MIVLLRGEANRYSISMLMELAPDLPKISAARVQLRQVLMNPWPPLLRPWRKQVGSLRSIRSGWGWSTADLS